MLSPFVLGQPPFMQFTDLNAVFMPFGKMYTYDWFTREPKETFVDPAGMTPQSNPIIMDGIGRLPMTWFATDSPYYLEIKDQFNNLIFQTPQPYIAGIGSGTILDEALDSPNLFINGQFYSYLTKSFSPLPINTDVSIADGGWRFGQSLTTPNPNDTLQFVAFSPDDDSISPGAVNYLNYTLTLPGTDDTIRRLYNVIPSVRTLANEQITISFEARSAIAGTFQLTAGVYQNFGTGGSPSAPVGTNLGAITLTTSWQQYTVTGVVPDLTGKTLGTNGDDYIAITIEYPLNTAQNINITNLYLKRGVAVVGYPYLSNSEEQARIYGLNGRWSTGDRKETYKTVADPGWVMLTSNATIGNNLSNATTRDWSTFALFTLLWNNISQPTSNVYCPVSFAYDIGTVSQSANTITGIGTTFTSGMVGGTIVINGGNNAIITGFTDATHLTVSTSATISSSSYFILYGAALGASATADYYANKVLLLPAQAGLLVGGTGNNGTNSYVLGQNTGAATVTLAVANMPTGMTFNVNSPFPIVGHTPNPGAYESGTDVDQLVDMSVTVTGPVGAANSPFSIVPLSTYVNYMIKL